MARGDSTASLAPGFRFHPTDEELVRYYLKRKVTNKPFRFDPIAVIDIYKAEPWDLPGMSKLKSRDLEWYFFSMLDKKYGNGSKTNRATEKGYWKTTGKDRPIRGNSRLVGMKKTLVYHLGRAPRGERSNWVMHEYRLADEDLEKAGVSQDALVLCRIFQKSGTGPKNGEQYGAPFVEEEWDDEEVPLLPGAELFVSDGLTVEDDALVEANDLDQNLEIGNASENAAVPLNVYYGDASHYVDHPGNYGEEDQKPIRGRGQIQYGSDLQDKFLDLTGQYEREAEAVGREYTVDSSNNVNDVDVNYLLDEPYLDAVDIPSFGEGLFLEANDLSDPVESDSAGVDSTAFDAVDDYLNFFDANNDNMTFDPNEIFGDENVSSPAASSQKDANEGKVEASVASFKLMETHGSTDASSSKQMPEAMKYQPDAKYPFLKQASHILGGIPAPPAFASEFPVKGAALQLNPGQPSSSVHVTAGMIRIESLTWRGNGLSDKNGSVNIALSFGFSQNDVNSASSDPMANLLSGKTGSVISWGWFFLMFFWVLIISVSYKIGTCICTK